MSAEIHTLDEWIAIVEADSSKAGALVEAGKTNPTLGLAMADRGIAFVLEYQKGSGKIVDTKNLNPQKNLPQV